MTLRDTESSSSSSAPPLAARLVEPPQDRIEAIRLHHQMSEGLALLARNSRQPGTEEYANIHADRGVLLAEIDRLQAGRLVDPPRFDPSNHHNALACPYCNPDNLSLGRLVDPSPPKEKSDVADQVVSTAPYRSIADRGDMRACETSVARVDPSPPTESAIVLRPSPRGGVGCFTTTAIPRGAVVHLFDEHDWTFVAGDADSLPEPFAHYVVLTKGGYWRPLDFRRMSVGWYLNHSDAPNLRKEHDTYFAIHDIASDVELTIDYRTLDADEDNAVGLARVDPSPPTRILEARGILLIELLRYTSHRDGCAHRYSHTTDCHKWEGFHEHRYLNDAEPCSCDFGRRCNCGLSQATEAMLNVLERAARVDPSTLTKELSDIIASMRGIERAATLILSNPHCASAIAQEAMRDLSNNWANQLESWALRAALLVPTQTTENKDVDTRVAPLTAGVDGQDLPQSGNEE